MDTPDDPTLEVVKAFIDERLFDPVANIKMGLWYYLSFLRQYNGDREKANTAYNQDREG